MEKDKREERDRVVDLKTERLIREIKEMTRRILKAKGYPAALALFMLAGCGVTPQQLDARLDALEARLESEVDATIERAVKILCELPIDVMHRNVKDSPLKAEGAYLMCEDLRALVDLLAPIAARRAAIPTS